MAETKWTPGPWRIDDEFAEDGELHVDGPGWGSLAIVHLQDDEHGCAEGNANAHLIRTAPELAEALEPFAAFACDPPCCDPPYVTCHNCRARAVLAKARGESDG